MSNDIETTLNDKPNARFSIYRASDARDYADHPVMTMDELTPVVAEGLKHFAGAGDGDGQVVKLLYAAPGFSLSYVWFKSGYPLPLHSHTSDCLYHIVGGSLRIGHEELGIGDGFFVGTDVPYTYTPGPQGVEVLEFRNTDKINIRFRGGKTAWEKAAQIITGRTALWTTEQPPRVAASKA
jgi:hypothetical protein